MELTSPESVVVQGIRSAKPGPGASVTIRPAKRSMRTRDCGLDHVLELPNSAKAERAANQGYPLISLTRFLFKTTSRKEGGMGRSTHLALTAYRSTVYSSSHQVLGALPSLTHLTQSASSSHMFVKNRAC